MATSGVSTIATSFGGAVNIAALPNIMGNVPAGVPVLVDIGLIDVLGVLARVVELILNLLLVVEALETLAIRDGRREEDCELDMRDEVERARDETVRVRGTVGTVLRLADNDIGEVVFGEGGPINLLDVGGFVLASSASSCHWRCMMIDLVAQVICVPLAANHCNMLLGAAPTLCSFALSKGSVPPRSDNLNCDIISLR